MKKKLKYKFVRNIPSILKARTLYISVKYKTCIHKCMCGCGNEVVTPLSKNDWTLKYNGDYISLSPSIGNWNFKCRSHYWIRKNEVIECRKTFWESIGLV